MFRFPYPDLSRRPENVQKLVQANPLNAVRMMASASPEVFEKFYRFGSAFYTASSLAADHREIGILRAGYIANASYETSQHESIAKSLGVTDAQIAAIRAGEKRAGVLSESQQAVLNFSSEFIVDASVSDAALAGVRKHLSDEQVMDLMFVTGLFMTISRIVRTTGVTGDDELIDAKKMQELAKVS